jgi:hypothetical protein
LLVEVAVEVVLEVDGADPNNGRVSLNQSSQLEESEMGDAGGLSQVEYKLDSSMRSGRPRFGRMTSSSKNLVGFKRVGSQKEERVNSGVGLSGGV